LIAPRAEFRDVPDMPDRSHWTIRKFSSFEEQRCEQICQWQLLPAIDRANAVWQMAVEYSRQYASKVIR
jgi:hypothetical protein